MVALLTVKSNTLLGCVRASPCDGRVNAGEWLLELGREDVDGLGVRWRRATST